PEDETVIKGRPAQASAIQDAASRHECDGSVGRCVEVAQGAEPGSVLVHPEEGALAIGASSVRHSKQHAAVIDQHAGSTTVGLVEIEHRFVRRPISGDPEDSAAVAALGGNVRDAVEHPVGAKDYGMWICRWTIERVEHIEGRLSCSRSGQ